MRRKPDLRAEGCQEYFDALINGLRFAAERCGYAIAVHGSLKRDIDLVACPWRESAISAHALIDELRKVVEAIGGTCRQKANDRQPEKKPAGRLGWSFYLTHDDNGPYLDISVMPQGVHAEEEEKQDGEENRTEPA